MCLSSCIDLILKDFCLASSLLIVCSKFECAYYDGRKKTIY